MRTTTARDALLDTFADLCALYPEMRVGQLLAFVSTIAGQEDPALMEDARALDHASAHARHRANALGVAEHYCIADLPVLRRQLLEKLREISHQQEQMRFGQIVCSVATSAQYNIYDIEDDQLLAAAKSQELNGAN